jgi:histone deacetylase complex regulatory component SIN3
MENAGLDPSGGSGGEGEVTREEFDQLVDQNQQIIDLLEDVVNQIKSQNNVR